MTSLPRAEIRRAPRRLVQLTLSRTSFPLGVTPDDLLPFIENRAPGSEIQIAETELLDETTYITLIESHDDYENSGRVSLVGVSIDPLYDSVPNAAAPGLAISLDTTSFALEAASGSKLAGIKLPANWSAIVMSSDIVPATVVNGELRSSSALTVTGPGRMKLRAENADNSEAIEKTFAINVTSLTRPTQPEAPTEPTTPIASRTSAIRVGFYGDSFGQWAQIFTGSPNSLDTGMVDPQGKKMPTELTSLVGGNGDGYLAMLNVLSKGKYVADWHNNFAIGGMVTGQLRRKDGDTVSQGRWLSWAMEQFSALIAAGRGPDVIIVPAGTNDASTTASATESFNNIVVIITELLKLSPNMKVVYETFGPKGGSDFPAESFAPDVAATHKARRDKLVADLVATFPAGRVALSNGWAGYEDTAGVSGDILPGLTLDGLHRAPPFGQLQIPRVIAALDSLFPTVTVGGFLGSEQNLLPAGAGTSGSVTRGGGAASTTGFAATGQCWTDWALSGGSGWIGTNGNNVTGTLTASVDAQGRQVIEIDGNAAGKTNKNPVAVVFKRTVPAAALAALTAGELLEMAARVQVSDMVAFRGIDLELRVREPDGTLRTLHTLRPGQISDRKNLEWTPSAYTDANALVLRSAFREIKTGVYGDVEVALTVHFAGQAPQVKAKIVVDPTVTLAKV